MGVERRDGCGCGVGGEGGWGRVGRGDAVGWGGGMRSGGEGGWGRVGRGDGVGWGGGMGGGWDPYCITLLHYSLTTLTALPYCITTLTVLLPYHPYCITTFTRAVASGPAGPAMAGPVFLCRYAHMRKCTKSSCCVLKSL